MSPPPPAATPNANAPRRNPAEGRDAVVDRVGQFTEGASASAA
jgi:hypothetical protein